MIAKVTYLESVSEIYALCSCVYPTFGYVQLLGYSDFQDGGEGWFKWDPSSLDYDDGGIIFRPSDLTATDPGRLIRQFNGPIGASWYGGNIPSLGDAAPPVNSAIIAANRSNKLVDFNVGGIYNYTSPAFTASIAAATTSITASISGTTMTVTAVSGGNPITPGAVISGTGVTTGTRIVQQLTGAIAGTGTYQLDIGQTVGSTTITCSYGAMMVSAVSAGKLMPYQKIDWSTATAGAQQNTLIMLQLSGSSGATGTYAVNQSPTVSSTSMTASMSVVYGGGGFVSTAGGLRAGPDGLQHVFNTPDDCFVGRSLRFLWASAGRISNNDISTRARAKAALRLQNQYFARLEEPVTATSGDYNAGIMLEQMYDGSYDAAYVLAHLGYRNCLILSPQTTYNPADDKGYGIMRVVDGSAVGVANPTGVTPGTYSGSLTSNVTININAESKNYDIYDGNRSSQNLDLGGTLLGGNYAFYRENNNGEHHAIGVIVNQPATAPVQEDGNSQFNVYDIVLENMGSQPWNVGTINGNSRFITPTIYSANPTYYKGGVAKSVGSGSTFLFTVQDTPGVYQLYMQNDNQPTVAAKYLIVTGGASSTPTIAVEQNGSAAVTIVALDGVTFRVTNQDAATANIAFALLLPVTTSLITP